MKKGIALFVKFPSRHKLLIRLGWATGGPQEAWWGGGAGHSLLAREKYIKGTVIGFDGFFPATRTPRGT